MRSVTASAEAFAQASARVREARIRPEFRVDEAPAPQRLAPFALALTVESAIDDRDPLSGRFVLLHDPDGVDEWDGDFRAVIFARASLEPDSDGRGSWSPWPKLAPTLRNSEAR